ncbi:carbohydrate binding family 9 domain-containing protein [Psychrosphaera sp. F3M07]|uniref:carbohydrate binding family 9 domain-containing protein n=1 Tax=Psychrosphaera sp. F3M07 TaxID=2841560 RepID=UPI001C096FE7|nr:carbohydrate binding family 9 domain-containing protein [Psychrosphaera sp. F3M07]MBU2919323.1 carbohydrate binding family 9 domain-containing protein [Psychrosphaera sp. F3M07]
MIKNTLIIITLSLLSFGAFALEKAKYTFHHDQAKAKIDGKLSEAVWRNATKFSLDYNINPGDNSPAPVQTEIMLYENGKSLFVAFIAHDPDPSKIRAYFRDRDTMFQDDFVGIVIDTFNDERRAYEFFVNAYGVQGDLIKDDTQGGNEDSNWDAIWNSAGVITDTGYIVEMEIPFNALRFPSDSGEMTWGIDALRIYPRDSRMVLASNKSDRAIDCHLCQITKISGLKNIKQGNNFQLTPTLTSSRSDSKDEVPGPWQNGKQKTDAGVDLRWGINQDLYLNATINPDFSQVEADAAQLDVNNTYSLFFNEKRPFFLDGKDYFDTQRMNLVHTRNIASPEYGMKLTGKSGDNTYGLLTTNDASTAFLMPEHSGSDIAELDMKSEVVIARYRMDVGDRNNVGVLLTNRSGDQYRNTVASIDGRYQFNKKDSLSYQIAHSDSKNPEAVQQDFDVKRAQTDGALNVRYNHNTRNFNYGAGYSNYGKDFRSDLGFTSRVDYEQAVIFGEYTWYGKEGSPWTRYGVFGDWDKTYSQDGIMLEEEFEIHGNLQGPKQFYSNFGVVHRNKYWDGEYYKETHFMQFARFNPTSNTTIGGFYRFGDAIDFANSQLGDILILEAFADVKLGKHLSSEINFAHQSLDVPNGTLFTANQYDIRVNYQFNLKSYLRLVIQYTDIDRDVDLYTNLDEDEEVEHNNKYVNTQLLYAYKINPQTLFYLGYADGGFQDDNLSRIEKDSRTVFMKMSYAWQL